MKTKSDDYLIVFADCFLVKGAKRSTIFDYQREDLYFIENTHYDFLMKCRIKPYQQVKSEFRSLLTASEIEDLISFCQDNELIFWTQNPNSFPQVNEEFDHPSIITNAIIDVNKGSDHNFDHIFNELQSVMCKDVQMRFYDSISLIRLERIIKSSRLNQHGQSIELIIKMNEELTKSKLLDLTYKFIFIKSIIVHSADKNDLFRINSHATRAGMGNILFTKQNINSSAHCGFIHAAGFNYNNISAFMEAKHFNSCLNRKVGIDENGLIKNCPTQTNSFGHINSNKLLDVCLNENFQKLWKITKDDIEVCRDCEFRYICSDCRMFRDNDDDLFSKPKKCSYNPYSNTWESYVS